MGCRNFREKLFCFGGGVGEALVADDVIPLALINYIVSLCACDLYPEQDCVVGGKYPENLLSGEF